MITGGVPIRGEFSSADATALTEANSRLLLYGQGSASAVTLTANDHVLIHSVTVSSAATNALVQVYDGADNAVDAGEEIFGAIIPTNTNTSALFGVPVCCQKGRYPKVKASAAGNVRVQFRGMVVRAGT